MRENMTRRERQIVEILYAHGEATAHQIRELMPDDLADATVRTLLRIMETKGAVVHRVEGKRFVYRAKGSHQNAAGSALRRVLDVFFGGSIEKAVAMHLADPKMTLDPDEVKRLRELVLSQSKKKRAQDE
jgi:BlaI family transcriptional regulator, penicillinase repressor